jgi:hypothetical protein
MSSQMNTPIVNVNVNVIKSEEEEEEKVLLDLETKIEFHDREDCPVEVPVLFKEKGMNFGKINIKTGKVEMTKRSILIKADIDCSGSMESKCEDGKSKEEHAIHSLINIIKLIVEYKELDAWLMICAFDDKIDEVIAIQKVTEDNFMDLINKVRRIIPRGGTDIGLVLNNTKLELDKFRKTHPEFILIHILATDGNATVGITDKNELSKKIDTSYNHMLIGYGLDVSYELMTCLSKQKNVSYDFIYDIEKGGLVFGEIIFKILFVKYRNVVLLANENVEMYDNNNNIWTRRLEIENLTSESNKTINLRSMDPNEVNIKIFGNEETEMYMEGGMVEEVLADEILYPSLNNDVTDLSTDMFRQRTLELIHDALNVEKSNDMKKKLEYYLAQMKKYMSENDKMEDESMKSLCDDIYIVIKTYGTIYGDLFAGARSNSNGRETSYTTNTTPRDNNNCFQFPSLNRGIQPSRLSRQTTSHNPQRLGPRQVAGGGGWSCQNPDMFDEESDEIDKLTAEIEFETELDNLNHIVQPTLSRHTTVTQHKMMRAISE